MGQVTLTLILHAHGLILFVCKLEMMVTQLRVFELSGDWLHMRQQKSTWYTVFRNPIICIPWICKNTMLPFQIFFLFLRLGLPHTNFQKMLSSFIHSIIIHLPFQSPFIHLFFHLPPPTIYPLMPLSSPSFPKCLWSFTLYQPCSWWQRPPKNEFDKYFRSWDIAWKGGNRKQARDELEDIYVWQLCSEGRKRSKQQQKGKMDKVSPELAMRLMVNSSQKSHSFCYWRLKREYIPTTPHLAPTHLLDLSSSHWLRPYIYRRSLFSVFKKIWTRDIEPADISPHEAFRDFRYNLSIAGLVNKSFCPQHFNE